MLLRAFFWFMFWWIALCFTLTMIWIAGVEIYRFVQTRRNKNENYKKDSDSSRSSQARR